MNDDPEIREWLKWIAGGILAFLVVFWQWIERKIELVRTKIDELREKDRSDRHAMDSKYQTLMKDIDEDIDKLKDRVSKLERNKD